MTITVPIVETGPTAAAAGATPPRTAVVLHGGGGPRTVAPLVGHLAASMHVLAPTHPGWDGTARPESITSVRALATAYLDLLAERGERDVVLVGSSIGGWLALEMALQAAGGSRYAGVVGAVVDIDGVGAVVEGEPLADFFALDARGLAEAAWHDPDRGYVDPAGLTEAQRAVQQGNGRTMAAIAGDDPELLGRLGGVDVPVLVLWGASDRIGTPAYGRVVAGAIPGARFEVVERAGHLPHLERPDATFEVIDAFLS
ncbi:alpha/beta fold hydrolase [Curtobacterium sp. Leaf261]|uniref:alpha/beta fold hydrolase n=1 Tax=Curtobacterium sp. Leaf261 TaxID=1736311 RepID=UPI0006F32952|nr:alpha/beta hydrolase [Curtobacterium sp. Leaf261]KQO62808.1 hydrolase [Curtobacterium sp. Leaf261]